MSMRWLVTHTRLFVSEEWLSPDFESRRGRRLDGSLYVVYNRRYALDLVILWLHSMCWEVSRYLTCIHVIGQCVFSGVLRVLCECLSAAISQWSFLVSTSHISGR